MEKSFRRLSIRISLLVALCFAVALTPAWAQYTNLYSFTGSSTDGAFPHGSLTLSGKALYGMTSGGGAAGAGVIFKINTNGSGYTNLHVFTRTSADGASPYGSLTPSGNTFYGVTSEGGADGYGIVFKIETDGSGFTILHTFTGSSDDGAYPYGSLTMKGKTLYGTTYGGGADNEGVVFKIDTDGSGYTNLYSFAGGSTDGAHPLGTVTLSGKTLYGMAHQASTDGYGVLFKINTDGSGYAILHTFTGTTADGAYPDYVTMILKGKTLYAMANAGGTDFDGVVFKINTDGSEFAILHSFTGGSGDGADPYGSLTLKGKTLYGMTGYGGASDLGVVFQINMDGSGYTSLYSFAGSSTDGASPHGSVTLGGKALYGMTYGGGADGEGVVFSITP
ncbi:MAG TPA: choice-of-anchor tandem repeat GloVer-containing protein [Verrucomicrobiae bacterium]|nr:choice-of-anchor tandem repeat GloVer-containing protein [Verrucomicrobiae bacterium]